MFSANMVDIDKILNVKPKIKFKTIIPEQYWDYLNVFDKDETNQLPSIRGKKITKSSCWGKKINGPLGAVIQYVKKWVSGIEENINRISG